MTLYMQFIYGISVVYFFSTVPFFQQSQIFLMFAVSMLVSRTTAVIAGTAIAICSIIAANIHYQLKEITFFSPFSWLDILLSDGTKGYIHPYLWQIVIMILVVIISCTWMLYKKVKHINFLWTKEQ